MTEISFLFQTACERLYDLNKQLKGSRPTILLDHNTIQALRAEKGLVMEWSFENGALLCNHIEIKAKGRR